jgi:hypothetical protein
VKTNKRVAAILEDIVKNPLFHRHEFDDLIACCMIDGIVHAELMEAHKKVIPQRNPGGCDVWSGPCSCGAWH